MSSLSLVDSLKLRSSKSPEFKSCSEQCSIRACYGERTSPLQSPQNHIAISKKPIRILRHETVGYMPGSTSERDKQVEKCKKAADKKSMDSSRLKSILDEQSGIKKSDGSPQKNILKPVRRVVSEPVPWWWALRGGGSLHRYQGLFTGG